MPGAWWELLSVLAVVIIIFILILTVKLSVAVGAVIVVCLVAWACIHCEGFTFLRWSRVYLFVHPIQKSGLLFTVSCRCGLAHLLWTKDGETWVNLNEKNWYESIIRDQKKKNPSETEGKDNYMYWERLNHFCETEQKRDYPKECLKNTKVKGLTV